MAPTRETLETAQRMMENLIQSFVYRDWKFTAQYNVNGNPADIELFAHRRCCDSTTGELIPLTTSRTIRLLPSDADADLFEDALIDALWLLVSYVEDHERGEFFRLRGKRPYMPSHTPNGNGTSQTYPCVLLPHDEWKP